MLIKTSVNIAPSTDTQTETLSPEVISATQEAVKQQVVLQPIVQPVVYQDAAKIPIQWQATTAEPLLQETITPAEAWATATVAQPLIAKGIKVYNDTIPTNEVRPREYVVMTVDEEVRAINFSGNKSLRKESFCMFIIQGQGNTFDNWVIEITIIINKILQQELEKGQVRNITELSVGFDETARLLTRTISVWYQY